VGATVFPQMCNGLTLVTGRKWQLLAQDGGTTRPASVEASHGITKFLCEMDARESHLILSHIINDKYL
jgi:hypothetical protein